MIRPLLICTKHGMGLGARIMANRKRSFWKMRQKLAMRKPRNAHQISLAGKAFL